MEFRVLGPLEVWHAGELVPLRGRRQRALVGLLVLHANQVVSADRLLDELWGEELPASGAKALQVRISQLRRTLSPGAMIETISPGYRLRVQRDEVDLSRFEDLLARARAELARGESAAAAEDARHALALWRGDTPLGELASSSWAQGELRRLEDLRLTALELRVDAELELGRHDELVPELEALVLANPLRERFREQLMLALYRCGRQADALAAYQEARDLLVDQLGIDPGPALQRLQHAILVHDEQLEPAAQAVEAPTRSVLVLVERETDLPHLLPIAEPLAGTLGPRELVLAGIVPQDGEMLRELGRRLEETRADLASTGTVARSAVLTSAGTGDTIARFAGDLAADLLLAREPFDALGDERPPEGELGALLADCPCDVAILVESERSPSPNGPVVVPFGGSEHEWAALELGVWLAHGFGAGLHLVGTGGTPADVRPDASRLLANASVVVQRLVDVAVEPVLVPRGPEHVAGASEGASVLVLGLPDGWRQRGLGSARSWVAENARAPVLVVRRGTRPGGLAPAESLTRFTWSLEGVGPEATSAEN